MGTKSTVSITRRQALNFVTDFVWQVDKKTLAKVVELLNDAIMEKDDQDSLGHHSFEISGPDPTVD